ncbi:MAG TPA: GAF domain-containing protein [Ktedonobacteraceae bacterium]|nr:GAF domain-containing protein [Ktedonobacteraceae bacterium]
MAIFIGKANNMHEARTWRELLADIIRDGKEKQRLIEELGITSITLTRWVTGESDPRPQNLRRLITVLPQYREQLRVLLKEESDFSEEADLEPRQLIKEIPCEFYALVLQARASTTENLRFWSTCQLILQQALEQLDPERLGMSIWVVCCMPPSGPYNKVRSLRESVGVGTPPWASNLEQTAVFLGAESLVGNVVTLCRPTMVQDVEQERLIMPAGRVEYERSAAIYPILFAGRVAGVLLVFSTQKNYFVSQVSMDLIERYADLIALAFNPQEFYAPEQIALSTMPSPEEQKVSFAKFRHLVSQTMRDAAQKNQLVSSTQADLLVWQKLEDELLQIPVSRSTSP